MSAESSLTEYDNEELNAAVIDLKNRLELLHGANEKVTASISFLTEILTECDKFKSTVRSDTSKIAEKCGIKGPSPATGETFKEMALNQNQACNEVIKAFINKKITDPFNKNEIRKIRAAFEDDADLEKYFFSVQPIPIPKLTQKTIETLHKPLDPMRFTSLFNFPDDFAESSDFDKCCAFQLFNTHLERIATNLSSQQCALTAKHDDTMTFLRNPQEKTLETFPKFMAIAELHKKIRKQISDIKQSCADSNANIIDLLEQIKNKLGTTTEFFNTNISEMFNLMNESRDKYVRTCIELCKYRTIEQIKEKSDGGVISKHAESLEKYSEAEDNFVNSIVDDEKLRKFLEDLVAFKNETMEANEEYRKVLSTIENKTPEQKTSDIKDEKKSLRNISKIMEDQVSDCFESFTKCFSMASDMTQQASDFISVLNESGSYLIDSDFIISEVAKNPSASWMENIEEETKKRINEKREETSKINEEIERMNKETDELRKKNEELSKSYKEHKSVCKECARKPRYCSSVCGHTFCKKCCKAAKKEGKCPICGAPFSKADAIKIQW